MNNTQCRGYILKALNTLGYDKKAIDEIMEELSYQFDMMSEEKAEDYYNNN